MLGTTNIHGQRVTSVYNYRFTKQRLRNGKPVWYKGIKVIPTIDCDNATVAVQVYATIYHGAACGGVMVAKGSSIAYHCQPIPPPPERYRMERPLPPVVIERPRPPVPDVAYPGELHLPDPPPDPVEEGAVPGKPEDTGTELPGELELVVYNPKMNVLPISPLNEVPDELKRRGSVKQEYIKDPLDWLQLQADYLAKGYTLDIQPSRPGDYRGGGGAEVPWIIPGTVAPFAKAMGLYHSLYRAKVVPITPELSAPEIIESEPDRDPASTPTDSQLYWEHLGLDW